MQEVKLLPVSKDTTAKNSKPKQKADTRMLQRIQGLHLPLHPNISSSLNTTLSNSSCYLANSFGNCSPPWTVGSCVNISTSVSWDPHLTPQGPYPRWGLDFWPPCKEMFSWALPRGHTNSWAHQDIFIPTESLPLEKQCDQWEPKLLSAKWHHGCNETKPNSQTIMSIAFFFFYFLPLVWIQQSHCHLLLLFWPRTSWPKFGNLQKTSSWSRSFHTPSWILLFLD